jgi:predicted helicase
LLTHTTARMSKALIAQYYNNVDKLIQYGGTRKETSVRNFFYLLLNHYAEKRNLVLVPELPVRGTKGRDVTPDGTLKNVLRLEYGYWESKDESLNLDEEIEKKIKKGYPLNNILFEDSQEAILIQGGQEVMRINMRNADELDRILNAFVNFKNPFVRKFEDAIGQFQDDIPVIIETLREKIGEARQKNLNFVAVSESFLELCRAEINPDITMADVREMMIQHILTGDIFNKVFGDPEFHRHNNIANELEKLVGTLFDYSERRNLLGSIEHYYDAINTAAASVADHHEKQKFLKALYENFYKAYNPKAADRLGVVYTPNEIVDFMVDSTNHLLEKHFNRLLWDKNVEILDPATGTGTFICSIIDKCPKQYLVPKYKKELHANDVAILPYYVANLNIEYTFKQKMGYFEEFPNICFVDTLDNVEALSYAGMQQSLFGFSSENAKRISNQNSRKISVVIGNPPYNAKQENYNYQNSNRAYQVIDKRIKDTFIKYGTAQNQIVVYDMYTRFYRWAFDRIDRDGIVCFITNNSFINGRAFDGFRKCIQEEFDYAYIVDFGGNIRELSGKDGIWLNEEHTIFGIAAAVGISVMWLVREYGRNVKNCKINYIHPCDIRATRREKMEWISGLSTFAAIQFTHVIPDKKNNWINQSDNDFDELLPLIDKNTKAGKTEKAVFKLFSRGVATQRDEWVYDYSNKHLETKIRFFLDVYQKSLLDPNVIDSNQIKWDRELAKYLARKIEKAFDSNQITEATYRPFFKQQFYFDKHFNGMTYQWFDIYNPSQENLYIAFAAPGTSKDFHVLTANTIIDLHYTGDSQCIPLKRFSESGQTINNITDWGLQQFAAHYLDVSISKEDIFHYVYAVLHNPAYRKKYELNLKRDFPRIPFYKDFWQWAAWGKKLMDLHIGYETVEPYPLKEHNYEVKAEARRQKEMFTVAQEPEPMFGIKPKVKVKLRADKQAGIIEIDELTFLSGVPNAAWEYKLGNRSALEWILDQYKEKKPKDPTIAEKFNTYRFADYKEKVIDLLKRVCTVSVETVRVVGEMEGVK